MQKQNIIRLQFLGLYVLGLVLLFMVGKAFWEEADTVKQEITTSTPPPVTAAPSDEAIKQIENLKATLQQRDKELSDLKASQQQSVPKDNGSNATIQQQLKALADKDQVIASLESRLKQKEATPQKVVTNSGTNDAELKSKYEALKAAYEKKVANEKAISGAYKSLVDDNKRLVIQLQSLKKG